MTKISTSIPIIDKPSKDLAERPYSDEELEPTSEMKDKIEKLIEFFNQFGINYDKIESISKPKYQKLDTKAYPNFEQYMHVPGQRDTSKWLETVKTLYYKEKNGISRVAAIRQATSGWNHMETFDFLNWLKFYESGSHLKYKYAQLWYENDSPGYFLHIKQDPKETPVAAINGTDIDNAMDASDNEMSNAEKKSIIEKQRQKIIGRLDSAEKLFRTRDGQMFAGKELESLMESIYNLKKKIQLINKLSISTRLYEDMIIRQANILQKNGFTKASQTLYSLAQTQGQVGEGAKGDGNNSPQPATPEPPSQSSGSVGGLPAMGPGQPQNPPDSAPNDPPTSILKENKPKGIADFLEGMETSKVTTTKDKQNNDDELEVIDQDLIVEAQMVPEMPTDAVKPTETAKPLKAAPLVEKPLEVSEEDELDNKPKEQVRDFDNMVDAAFANLSVNDVVIKLEDLAKVFKTREIPRQLSIVDMMLDSLGLASYFPSLSEAINKSLEGNNYISTRIEDILSKLRGSLKTNDIDLKGDNTTESNPEVENIKKNLQQQDDKEKARKQMRKDQENVDLENGSKETPEVEIEEDLSAPVVPAKVPLPPAAKPVVKAPIV